MTDKRIEPALTPEEWEESAVMRPEGYAGQLIGVNLGWPWSGINVRAEHSTAGLPQSMTPAVIALANAALPDSDPRKITREKVEALRVCAKAWGGMQSLDTELANLAFLDALSSYLPPEER